MSSTVLDVIRILPIRFENHNHPHYKKDAFEILIGAGPWPVRNRVAQRWESK